MLHTDIPSRNDIERLAAVREPACLSLYLPTSPVTAETQGDRITLKNLARTGLDDLRARDVDRKAIEAIEEGIDDLVDDSFFWTHQATSLAVFATASAVLTFRLPNKLEPSATAGDRFHIKPLLRSITVPQSAFVLALAQGSVRLVEVSADMPAMTCDVVDLPTDVASAVGQSSILDRSPSGRIQGSEGQKVRMRQYARKVDTALRDVLAGRETPLILAAAAPIDSIFRSVNTYPFLIEEGIDGNPEKTTDAELAQASRAILDRVHHADLAELGRLFEVRTDQGRTTNDVVKAARAATFGAVAILLVDIDAVVPGTVDPEDGAVTLMDDGAPGSYDVIDEITRRSLASGAQVLAVRSESIPAGGSLAAILRYPL